MAGEINFSGFNGFDFNSIIEVTIEAESAPLLAMQEQEKTLKKKVSALGDFGAEVSKVQDTVESLLKGSTFTKLEATSSDEDVSTVTLGDSAIAGTYEIVTTDRAKSQVTASTNGYALTTDTAADGGTISFTIDGSTTTDITISAATSVSELRTLINDQNSGVVASVVNDGTNNKLVITSRTTGATNGFTINNSLTNGVSTVVAFTAGQSPTVGNTQDAQDSAFTVNGLSITSATNTVTDAIPGTSVKLVSTGTVSITVEADYDSLEETVKTFITEFNGLKEFYQDQTKLDVITGKPGILARDSILRQALNDIKSIVLTSNGNDGIYSYLTEIGVEFEQDGTLSLNQEKYNTAVDNNITDVQKLFQGDGTVVGVFDNLKSALDNIDNTAGLIKTTRTNLDTTIKSLRDRIIAQQMRLENRRIELQKMYSAADQAMSRLSSQQGALSAIGSFY
jgi:flagellar hook-associated protein 2